MFASSCSMTAEADNNLGGGGGAVDGGGASTQPDPRAHYQCPVDRPQRHYGGIVPSLGGRLERDETWTPDNVYVVFGGFSTGPHTLTVMPGTVICFEFDRVRQVNPPPGSLEIPSGGAVRMLGTAAQPVVLTQLGSGYNYWLGLQFGSGFQPATTLQHVKIFDAGLGGPVISTLSEGAAGLNADPPLDLRDVDVYYASNAGVRVKGSRGLSSESRVTIHSYAPTNTDASSQYPAFEIHPLFAASLTAQMLVAKEAVPVRARVIQLGETIITRSTQLHDVGLPYRAPVDLWINGDAHAEESGAHPAVLTIDAGVTLQMGGMIHVGYHQNGAADLVVNGTAARPVTFTSMDKGWGGILFEMREVSAAVSKIDHAVIERAGAPGAQTIYNCQDGTSNYIGGEVLIQRPATSSSYAGPPIRNTTFRQPQGVTDGVRAACSTASSCITTDYTAAAAGNVFEGFPATCDASSSESVCTQRPLGCP